MPNHNLSPQTTIAKHNTNMPPVNGIAIFQNKEALYVVPLMPWRFMPKKPATKDSGRNRMVMKVKMKIALPLSSCRVSTRCTFCTARTLALF